MDISLSMYLKYLPLILALYVFTQRVLHKLQNYPPTPFPALPLIGHLYLLKKPFHRSLFKISDRHGPVLFLWFGCRRVLLVSSPSAAEDCLTKKNDIIFANRPRLLIGKHLGYNYTSMAWAPYGDHWRNLRRISSLEILSSNRLQMLSHIRADEVSILVRRQFRVSSEDPDQPVELKSAFFELTFNVMMRMIAGKRYYGKGVENKDEAKKFQEIVSEVTRLGTESAVGDFLPFLRWFGMIRSIEKRLVAIHEKRDKFMQYLIDYHRAKSFKCDSSSSSSSGRQRTMIGILLSLQETEPEYYTDEMIKSLMLVLFTAGTDTSSATMEWAMSHLLNDPELLKQAQTEIDKHVGKDRLINESDLGALPLICFIINETLRMHPPVAVLVPHESSEECRVGGFRIPTGTMLLMNLWGIQNDPKVWVDPGKFNPKRFEDLEVTRSDGFRLLPFGSGRRGCPGENLGMRMVGLALGSLLQCFDWERISKEEMMDMTEGTGAIVSKATPLMAKCRLRPAMVSLLSQICIDSGR